MVFDPPVEFDSLLVIIVRAGLTTDAKFSDVTLKGCVKGRWNSFSKIWKLFEREIVDIFFPISLNMYFGCSKEPSYETVYLSTHNICFD